MSLLRTMAPTRMLPSAVSSMRVSGSGLMSTIVRGRSTCSFIRSTSVVPPARNRASAAAAASRAVVPSTAVTNSNGFTISPPAANRLDRLDDARIGTATADVAAHRLAHIVVARTARLAEQRDSRHDLPGRAITALKAVVADERLLHRVEALGVGEAFNRGDRTTVDRRRQRQARQHAAAVDVNGTRAALTVVATLLRAGEMEVLPQSVEQ